MGRPKKKLTDNSVKVRYKTLADGRKSVYLDCCDGGRRTYDFLKLYLLPETDRETVRRNKATMKKVEELQRERTLQLLGIGNGGTGDKPVFHADMPLSEWMDAYIGEQKRYGVKNTAIITKVARILGTIAPDVRMSQVDKDFCLMFIDYLRNDYPFCTCWNDEPGRRGTPPAASRQVRSVRGGQGHGGIGSAASGDDAPCGL